MNNSKNDNLKWKTIDDLEAIEALLIIINKYYFRQDHHTPFTIEPLKSKIANGDSQFCIDILKRISDLKNLNLSHIQQQFLLELKQDSRAKQNTTNYIIMIE